MRTITVVQTGERKQKNDTESSPDKRRIYRGVCKRTYSDLQLPLQKITRTGAAVH